MHKPPRQPERRGLLSARVGSGESRRRLLPSFGEIWALSLPGGELVCFAFSELSFDGAPGFAKHAAEVAVRLGVVGVQRDRLLEKGDRKLVVVRVVG